MNLWALKGAPLVLAVRERLNAQRNSTSFAAGSSRLGSSEGTGTGSSPLITRPGAALHDRPNNDTDRKRIPDFRPFHADLISSETQHDPA